METLRGVHVAVVEGTKTIRLVGPQGGVRTKGIVIVDQTAWVDPKDGRILRMTATARWDTTTWDGNRRVRSDGVEQIELSAI
jgi:hypothetical protein